MKSNFTNDLSNSELVLKWLKDHYLIDIDEDIEITDDKENQLSGVDFKIRSFDIFKDNDKHNIDFKVAMDYIRPVGENRLPTFAFEVISNGNSLTEGWLYSEKYQETECFLLAWIWVDPRKTYSYESKITDFNYKSIEEMELLLVSKKDVQWYAKKMGYGREQAIEKAKKLIINNTSEKNKKPRLHVTTNKHEKPVNLVIWTKDLKKKLIERSEKENVDLILLNKTVNKNPHLISHHLEKLPDYEKYICQLANDNNSMEDIMNNVGIQEKTVIHNLFKGAKIGAMLPFKTNLPESKRDVLREISDIHGYKYGDLKNELPENTNITDYDISKFIIEKYTDRRE